MTPPAAVVLAAGKGARFHSPLPKVLQPIAGRPVLGHILHALAAAGIDRTILVVGHRADDVRAAFPTYQTVLQAEQRGTGHALQQAQPVVRAESDVLVVNGDLPLLTGDLVRLVVDERDRTGAPMVALTAIGGDTTGMGRIRRDGGRPVAIVEERDASEADRAITEWNVGLYCFAGEWLWPRLDTLRAGPSGEIYITDLFGIAAAEHALAAVATESPRLVRGVNTLAELSEAEAILRDRIRVRHLAAGVAFVAPETSIVDDTVSIASGTIILPGCVLTGVTTIGAACRIGPQTIAHDSAIGDGAIVGPSYLDSATVSPGERLAPYTSIPLSSQDPAPRTSRHA